RNRSCPTRHILSPRPDGDPDLAQRPDLETVTRPDQRGRAVFLDQGRAFALETWRECGAIVNLRRERSVLPTEIDRTHLRLARLHLRARQVLERGRSQPRERRKVQRLELCRRAGVGVAIAALIVAVEGP